MLNSLSTERAYMDWARRFFDYAGNMYGRKAAFDCADTVRGRPSPYGVGPSAGQGYRFWIRADFHAKRQQVLDRKIILRYNNSSIIVNSCFKVRPLYSPETGLYENPPIPPLPKGGWGDFHASLWQQAMWVREEQPCCLLGCRPYPRHFLKTHGHG